MTTRDAERLHLIRTSSASVWESTNRAMATRAWLGGSAVLLGCRYPWARAFVDRLTLPFGIQRERETDHRRPDNKIDFFLLSLISFL